MEAKRNVQQMEAKRNVQQMEGWVKRVIRITVKRATNGKYDMKELNEAEPVRREGKITAARDVFGIR